MRTVDKEIIRDAGRGEDRQAAKIFKLKMARDVTYRVVVPE